MMGRVAQMVTWMSYKSKDKIRNLVNFWESSCKREISCESSSSGVNDMSFTRQKEGSSSGVGN